LSVTEGLLEL